MALCVSLVFPSFCMLFNRVMQEAAPRMTLDQARALLDRPDSPYATTRVEIGGEPFTVFEHAPRNLGELFASSRRHDTRVMLVYEDERYGFPDVRRRAANLAHRLVHDYGVQKGDRVALAMRNYPEWCFAYMAATSIGAVIVPLNAWWTGPELRYGLEDSGARLLLCDDERLSRVASLLPSLQVTAIVARSDGALPDGVHAMTPLLEGEHALPEVDVAPEDDATIMYTSGSTGQPKGVVSTHRAVVSAVFTWEYLMLGRLLPELPPRAVARLEAWLARGPAAFETPALDLPQASMLISLPLFHVTGCNVQFLPAFRSGRKVVMMHKWNAERALELIEREKITDFNGVPTMSWELVNSPDFHKRDTSSLRSLSAGGAARPPEHVKRLREKAQQAQPSTGYGMTETNGLGTAIGGDDYVARPASAGRALAPLVEIKVIDEQGNPLPVGQEGEICIKSATNMRAYFNKPGETEKVLRGGFVHSGDLGYVDEEGFVYITGRAKDIVIRGGENVSCPEVEHALYEHPAVFECAVYGVPDERLGEAVAATIRVRAGEQVTAEVLQKHLLARIARFKVPAHFFLREEELPRVASGKIDKRALKQDAARRLSPARG
jgi:long-chain acyl-CoA synthetase